MYSNDTLSIRRSVESECRVLSRQPFELGSEEFEKSFDDSPEDNVYDHIGSYACKVFLEDSMREDCAPDAYNKLDSMVSRHGFSVIARILSAAPDEYKSYCAASSREADIQELAASLKESVDPPLVLMNMSSSLNSRIEQHFGLLGKCPISAPAFHFKKADDGKIMFGIDMSELRKARLYALQDGYAHEEAERGIPIGEQRCPARGLVIGKLWPAMVDLAAETPQAFRRDIA